MDGRRGRKNYSEEPEMADLHTSRGISVSLSLLQLCVVVFFSSLFIMCSLSSPRSFLPPFLLYIIQKVSFSCRPIAIYQLQSISSQHYLSDFDTHVHTHTRTLKIHITREYWILL